MKHYLLLAILLSFVFQTSLRAQKVIKKDSIPVMYRKSDAGIGLGLDYGGIFGVKGVYCPIPNLGLFGAVGLQFGDFGWQLGANGYILPKTSSHDARPYIKFMYGINASTYIYRGSPEYNATFKGATVGAGVEFRFGAKKNHGINLDLNFPFRTKKYQDMVEKIKSDPEIEIKYEPLFFTLSIGFHWEQ